MSAIRTALVFTLLLCIKYVSRLFFRFDFGWIGQPAGDPWRDIRLVAFLNHTSLFEPIFLGVVPIRFIWRVAAHGVVPAADKTTSRPFVGLLFKFVAHHVVPITRQRDETWSEVLRRIDPDSMVLIAPEGRMKRETGLDAHGQPMTVRGGIADILESLGSGRMLIAYSGGLHHVQIPGRLPRPFKTARLRAEVLEVADYNAAMLRAGGPESFKRNVRADLERRRDEYCPAGHSDEAIT